MIFFAVATLDRISFGTKVFELRNLVVGVRTLGVGKLGRGVIPGIGGSAEYTGACKAGSDCGCDWKTSADGWSVGTSVDGWIVGAISI